MKTIGFNFTSNDLRYCVLEGNKNSPIFIEKSKILYPNKETPELMEWLETQLSLIIDKHQPDYISHRISTSLTTLDQIRQSCYPQAILNLIANRKIIPINSFSPQAINPTKLGLPRNSDIYTHVDTVIGEHRPYWDKQTKDAVLIAWFNL